MKLINKPIQGKLIKRYKRFLADIELQGGEIITAHCANPGAMITLQNPGSEVWVSKVPDTSIRKLRYDWLFINENENLVGINTQFPNKIVSEALHNKYIEKFACYGGIKAEVKYGKQNSRIDFLLTSNSQPPCYLEVKGISHHNGDLALFPDAPTARGVKHLNELANMVQQGYKGVILYVVQRMDCKAMGIEKIIDPIYNKEAIKVKKLGVDFLCYDCDIDQTKITLRNKLPIIW